MHHCNDILVFLLDGKRYAIGLDVVERVLRAVEIDPVPTAPEAVRGLINVRGCIIPVIDIRALFCLPERNLDLNDRLIIVRTRERVLAFPVDDVAGVLERPDNDRSKRNAVLPEVECLEGVLALTDGMVLIYDLDRFLPSEKRSVHPSQHPRHRTPSAAAEETEGVRD